MAHSHPRFHAGGTELTALALHRQALSDGLDSWFLGALDRTQALPNLGTQMIALSDDHREAALFVEAFQRFSLSQDDHFGFLREFRTYLEQVRPDVVHVHHLLNFGLEALFVIRSTLPQAHIVLTVHDYYLICANHGQLYIHETATRCPGPTLTECLKCFPERKANDFAMRALDIRNALSLCDVLVSPSHFLKQKFEDYLKPQQPIEVVENGYLGADVPPAPQRQRDGTVVFGYFGNISAVKGMGDLLSAVEILARRGTTGFRVHVHGSQLINDETLRDRLHQTASAFPDQFRMLGAYTPETMGGLMADVDCVVFPSIWWENAPLVIYEALYHGRQVVAYPHGGAPEILARYGAGLIAGRSDPQALAETMQQAIETGSAIGSVPTGAVPCRPQLLRHYLSLYSRPN